MALVQLLKRFKFQRTAETEVCYQEFVSTLLEFETKVQQLKIVKCSLQVPLQLKAAVTMAPKNGIRVKIISRAKLKKQFFSGMAQNNNGY